MGFLMKHKFNISQFELSKGSGHKLIGHKLLITLNPLQMMHAKCENARGVPLEFQSKMMKLKSKRKWKLM